MAARQRARSSGRARRSVALTEGACLRSARSRRSPASGSRRTRRTGPHRIPRRSSGASSVDVFPWIAREASRIDQTRRSAGAAFGESNREERSKRRTASSRTAARCFATPSRRRAAESDPSRDLRGALDAMEAAALRDPDRPREVGRLLRDIESHEGSFATKCAMKLSPMLFVQAWRTPPSRVERDRPRRKAEWRIPAAEMKGATSCTSCRWRSRRCGFWRS